MALRRLASPLRLYGPRSTTRAASSSTSSSTSSLPGDDAANEKHLKRYPLVARGSGAQCTIKARELHEIRTDVPRSMGGGDEAPQLLLSALVGCEQATAAYVARHMTPRFKLKAIHFSVIGERDDRGATSLPISAPAPVQARLTRVSGEAVVHVRGPERETQARVEELARLVMQRCPVADMFHAAGTELAVRWRPAADGEGSLP